MLKGRTERQVHKKVPVPCFVQALVIIDAFSQKRSKCSCSRATTAKKWTRTKVKVMMMIWTRLKTKRKG